MAKKAKDYLAVLSIAGGIGSWARYPDRETAIKEVARIFRLSYRGIIKIKKGDAFNIAVIDVTGHKTVWWDANYFYDGETKLGPIEHVKHTY